MEETAAEAAQGKLHKEKGAERNGAIIHKFIGADTDVMIYVLFRKYVNHNMLYELQMTRFDFISGWFMFVDDYANDIILFVWLLLWVGAFE